MGELKINFEFTKKTQSILRKWERINIDESVNKSILKCIFEVQREAKMLAPVRTGYLRNNILVGEIGKTRGSLLSLAPYSLFVHEGHKTRGGTLS